MIDRKSVLGIIPARGGSKGVPQKNSKIIAGKPLISWTIKEALQSKYIDKLIVSTESDEIGRISVSAGAEIPFKRPISLALDTVTGNEVILHTLKWFEKQNRVFDYFIYLQPTSVFRKTEHIDKAIEKVTSKVVADSLVSVAAPSKHPYWMKKIDKKGFLEDFIGTSENFENRQSLPPVYAINGAIYISKWNKFLKHESFYKGNCLPFIMESYSSIDLDTMDDWEYAEYFLSKNALYFK